MPNPLLMFRTGWMESYQGVNDIEGGGSFVEEHGEGGEMWNFREEGGRYYGYVMTKNFAGIDLRKIAPAKKWSKGSELNNVDVVFFSRHPDHQLGQVVIGWYQNATVFHKEYRERRGREEPRGWSKIEYLCETIAEHGFLLPPDQRIFKVRKGKGFPGQSNVWYAEDSSTEVVDFKKNLRDHINRVKPINPPRGTGKVPPNKEELLAIETAAVKQVIAHYKNQGYEILSVERDNKGWDLEATNATETLLLEVKGHKGNVIQFELTPNEYEKLQENTSNYKVCVVRNALEKPDLTVFSPQQEDDGWYLQEDGGEVLVRLYEKVAAKAAQINLDD